MYFDCDKKCMLILSKYTIDKCSYKNFLQQVIDVCGCYPAYARALRLNLSYRQIFSENLLIYL